MRQSGTLAIWATALIGLASAPSLAGEPGSWACEAPAVRHPIDREQLRSISTKPSLRNVLIEYMRRWDAAEIRSSCEAFANGNEPDISCLNGRRDWAAIQNSVPDDLFGLPASAHRSHLLQLQDQGNGLSDAIQYCKKVGALTDPGFSLKVGDDS